MKKHIIFSLGAGIAIPFVFFGAIIVASLFYPGYSQSRQFASELGAGFAPHPWIYNTGVTLRGVAEIIAAYGFLRVFQKLKLNPVLGIMAVTILCISGISALLSAHYNFPDPRHRAYGLQAAIVIGPVLFAATLRRISKARGLVIFLLVNNVLLFATYFLSATPDNFGLMQRLRFLFSFPWVGICAYWLLWYVRKMPFNTALEPTGVGAGSSASRSTSSVAGGSALNR
jgi:hypothetical membrane protein